MFAAQADGHEILTVEGLAEGGKLHALQQGFWDQHGLQCGYCTPGMLLTSYALLKHQPNPSEADIREGLAGNLCRCTGYQNIVKAVQQAAATLGQPAGATSSDAHEGTTMSIQAKPLHSVGVPMKRKEDPRFIQGKGNYVDDLSFPGMLYLSLVRSTYPHAEIKNIDISEAMKVPGVKAVITGKDLEAAGLGWLPTFHGFDKQMVLAIGKVLFQYQEVAAVFAETRAAAVDGAEAVQVDYAPLPVVADPFTSKTDKVLLRPDREKKTNHIFHWEVGDKDGTARALASSPKRIKQRIWFQRCHPAPLEPCGCVAYFDTMGRLQFHVTSQAPHVYRTALSLVTGIPEDKIHVISPDLGGGFGNKVPVYPGYVCAIVGALKIGRPVKWIETRTENLTSTGFARDYHMDVEIGATADGKVTALHVATTADHGAFDAAADPTKYPGRHVRHRHRQLRRSRSPTPRSTRTSRTRRRAASPTAARSASPKRATRSSAAWTSWPTSWAWMRWSCARRTSSGRISSRTRRRSASPTTAATITRRSTTALEKIGYTALLKEQAEKRARGELMGIGFSTFTEVVGAGPSKHFDILGIKMFDSAEIRIHPTGAGIVRTGTKSQGQGHETTWAQIVAEELGLDPQNIMVEEGDTDTAPYGLGTYASRSTPVAGAAIAMAARRIREKARKIAAHLLEVGEADVEWTDYKFQVKGVPSKTVTMKEVAFAAYTNMAQNEPGLEATYYYDPPNMTYPERRVRRGRRRRSRDGRGEGAPLPRGRRLRHRHQPDDRRRADPRRPDRRLRDGVHAGDPVRRRGQQPEHQLHRLPRAHVARDAALGDRRTP